MALVLKLKVSNALADSDALNPAPYKVPVPLSFCVLDTFKTSSHSTRHPTGVLDRCHGNVRSEALAVPGPDHSI